MTIPNGPSPFRVKARRCGPDSFEGTADDLIWLLMPACKALHTLVAADSSFRVMEGDPENAVALTTSHRGRPLRIELVPGRDWLARRVILGDSAGGWFNKWEATAFAQSNGRWFPVEGKSFANRLGSVSYEKFKVSEFTVNEPIDPKRFAMPTPTEGVSVWGNSRIHETVGGDDAELRLTLRYLNAHPDAFPKAQVDAIRAHAASKGIVEMPPRFWLTLAIGFGLLPIFAVIAAWAMRRRWSLSKRGAETSG